jgi:RimJ/RimL family protein N-acetyltransferase
LQAIARDDRQRLTLMATELRSAGAAHYACEDNVRWMNDPEVTAHLRARPNVTLASARKYFEENNGANILLAIYHDGKHVGNAGFFSIQNETAELRICIGEKSVWGKGVGSEAVRLMVDFARQRGLHKIWLQVGKSNARARKIYEKIGFRKTGEDLAGAAPQDVMELTLES